MRKKRLSALIAVLIAVFSGCTNSDNNAGNVTSVNTTAALTVVTTTVSSAEAETTASATTAASSSESTVNNTVTEADSALPVITVDINGVAYELEYDESDNTWSTTDEELTKFVGIMKRECAKSPEIKGTYLLATDDDIIFIGGINSVDTRGNKVDAYTTYEIGSITKMFTATAVLQLCEQGKLSLDDTLGKFFPEFEAGKDITIYQLLHMQSGLRRDFTTDDTFIKENGERDFKEWLNYASDKYNDEDLFALLFDDELEYEPGTKFEYSNTGYTMLAMITEKITGMSYAEYIQKNIFDVCGMEHSSSMMTGDVTSVPEYAPSPDQPSYLPVTATGTMYNLITKASRGAGDIHSCAADMLAFDRALFGGKLLSESSLAEMFNTDKGYGCGWMPFAREKETFYHGGQTWVYIGYNLVSHTEKYGNLYLIQLHPTLAADDLSAGCMNNIVLAAKM